MNGVALYHNAKTNCYAEVLIRNSNSSMNRTKNKEKDLREYGYKCVRLILTNDEEIFYKARLTSALFILKDYIEECRREIDHLVREEYDDIVIEETLRLQEDYMKTLRRRVGRRTSSLYIRDIEVKDELAIQCFIERQKQMEEKRQRTV
jgi:hypothetical protein